MSDDQNSINKSHRNEQGENESPESAEPIALLAMKSHRITEALWASQVAPFVEQSRALLERLQPVVAVQRELQKAVAPALAAWQEWFRLTSPLTKVLEKWRQEMEPMLRNVALSVVQLGKFKEMVEQFIAEEEEISEAFQKGHLLLTPSMPLPLVRKVTALCKGGEYRRAAAVIAGYYRRQDCKNLEYMIDGWSQNRYFLPRKSIIVDCLEAHEQGKYTLSVPTLLAQIEGIASDMLYEADVLLLSGKKPRLGKTKSVVSSAINIGKKTHFHAIHDTLLSFVEEPLYRSRDFETEFRIIKKHRGLSRHGILHGIQTKYNTYTNSLRLFLVLDILFYISDDFKIGKKQSRGATR